ncbi:MAG: hypothetical protein COU85_01425 [Candidatus Portnoybacteria bacterium CG10_big_fil_rev_8_21_14_0_10_44_7]|uniref:Major facilitator superfamily (MFS) profile domain-containing protein n=1 Tax=Candidatus Portnoybacteria bacterium CG10_big_fil_rev_8_21_14_0_10_44_7 TaxID=1974816 RepID=A0A2M8KIV5_9BACT|nr:MAG: hypothetical protein COU85_01425 [Candidatus Portnoybacteria bacterium CG10_big_fil_rev_8_21_14_0_10_44_7]
MKTGFIILNIAFGAIFGLVGFLLTLFYSDPSQSFSMVIFLFYLGLFLALAGFLTLVGFLWRSRRQKNPNQQYILKISFRQGSMLSLLLVSVLVLQSLKIFYWWTALIIFLMIVLIEIYFSKKAD